MTWDRSKGRPEPIRALNRIVERESGEPLVALAEYAPSVIIKRTSVIPYLRLQVAQMLETAARTLPPDRRIGVVDAWRPFERQVRIWQWMWRALEEARPGLPYSAMRRMICRFVAPIDQKAPPGHTTGAAVDVWLLDEAGEQIDVVSPFTHLRAAPTYVYGLDEEAHRNRHMLVDAMLAAGFSNCRDEWWHYSFGDAGWAVRMDVPECIYGRIDLDPELYQTQEEDWLERLISRENPFLQEDAPGSRRSKAKRSADTARSE